MKQGSQSEMEASQKKGMPSLRPISEGPSIPEVIDRLEDLVRFALECEGKPPRSGVSFVEVYKQLEEVKRTVDALGRDQKELIELIEKTTGETIDIKTSRLSEEDKKILAKLQHLQKLCEVAKDRAYTKMKARHRLSGYRVSLYWSGGNPIIRNLASRSP